jgi:hypothetical protein
MRAPVAKRTRALAPAAPTGPWRVRGFGMPAEKNQMIMPCRSMRDSRAEWFHTFASFRPIGFRPTAHWLYC